MSDIDVTPRCERCPTPLKPTQGRYCSHACLHDGNRSAWRRSPLIAILEAQRGRECGWLTASDLAIWVFGDDTPAACQLILLQISRRRRDGCVIESRHAPWSLSYHGGRLAYRLAAGAMEVAA